jgi:hypothetical protein
VERPSARPPAGCGPLADWPLIPIEVESRLFSSFEHAGGMTTGSRARNPRSSESGEYVIFDARDSGRSSTLFTSGAGGRRPLDYTHAGAGTIESLRIQLSPESVFANAHRSPSIHGTGHEDDSLGTRATASCAALRAAHARRAGV